MKYNKIQKRFILIIILILFYILWSIPTKIFDVDSGYIISHISVTQSADDSAITNFYYDYDIKPTEIPNTLEIYDILSQIKVKNTIVPPSDITYLENTDFEMINVRLRNDNYDTLHIVICNNPHNNYVSFWSSNGNEKRKFITNDELIYEKLSNAINSIDLSKFEITY